MKNWKLLATDLRLSIPDEDLERIIPAMDALEAAFRPLVTDIPHETEPAVIFHVDPEEAA
jgi:hypothetical protein